jgi:NAD(P)-dependent dehydrogenase (short-subunit alcohol dehydrogenase family)
VQVQMSPSLEGKAYVVTGASRGIGHCVARTLIGRGARVALVARNAADVSSAAAELGPKAVPIPADVGDRDAITGAIAQAADVFGGLDGIVNNAGATMVCRVENLTEAAILTQVRVNFLGVVYASQAAIPHLRRNGGGRIVNVTSAIVRHADEFPFLSIYAATKAAAERFAFALREEVKVDNIGVTVVSPGSTDTTFGAAASAEEAQEGLRKWIEMGSHSDGAMPPDTVAAAIVHCLEVPPGTAFDFVEIRANRPTPKAMRNELGRAGEA